MAPARSSRAILGLAWTAAGRAGLGALLAVSFVLQVAPSVWTAYTTPRPTGISSGTWLFIFAELLCWGVYGLHKSDLRLTILGSTGVLASMLMLVRARRAGGPPTVAAVRGRVNPRLAPMHDRR